MASTVRWLLTSALVTLLATSSALAQAHDPLSLQANGLEPWPVFDLGTPPEPVEPEVPFVPAEETPTLPLAPEAWLARVNLFRGLCNLPSLTENATWSDGDYKHAIYCVKNNYIGHDEDPANPYYTPEGDAAAASSNVMVHTSTGTTDEYAIDMWITGPFHCVGIIDPKLLVTGFGSYREADGGWQMAAALDVLRGRGAVPAGVTFPVLFPANGKDMPLTSYTGGEYPDPLSSCSGYGVPTGPPIILQLGTGSVTPSVTAHSFSRGGTPLDHCIYDETSYTNTDAYAQSLARSVLGSRDAIVLIPRAALTDGTYTVSITSNGTAHTWSFTVGGSTPTGADVNGDGTTDVQDIFYLINYLFAGGPAPVGPGDLNGDLTVNVQDVFYLINYLFAGGPAPV